MKPLKYVLVFLLLCSMALLTAAPASAQPEVYTLHGVLFTNVDMGGVDVYGEELAPTITIMLVDGSNVEAELWLTADTVFRSPAALTGLQTEELTFAQFAEIFLGAMIHIDFFVDEYGEHFLVEASPVLFM